MILDRMHGDVQLRWGSTVPKLHVATNENKRRNKNINRMI